MERTEWLSLNSADARFLMLTAITHHTFSSPIWGEHEVRKLHAELAELDRLAAQAVADHNVARSGAGRTTGVSPAFGNSLTPVMPSLRRARFLARGSAMFHDHRFGM